MTDGSDSVCNGRVAEYVMEASGNTGRDEETLDWDSSSRKKQIDVKGAGVVDLYWISLSSDYISESPSLHSFRPILATRDILP